MIQLGKGQRLEVVKLVSFGCFLKSKNEKDEDGILLPQKQVPSETKVGDEIDVFVYRDSQDRLIATTRTPKIVLGELQVLKVVEITQIGAFLDWGLERDLFLPFKEQIGKIEKNKDYLVSLYIDKSDRLCATMDVYKYLESLSPYKENDKVNGIIVDVKRDMGAFVAVDNKYHGLIPKHELHGDYKCGDKITGRITKVREDGKLNLSLKEKAYIQMDHDTEIILEKLDQKDGILHLNDKSSPDKIKEEVNMSKNAFKRAVGRLLKAGKIKFSDEGIEKVNEPIDL